MGRSYQYTNILEYVPKRFMATIEQDIDREIVYSFKKGYCSEELKEKIVDKIKMLMSSCPGGYWEVCFIHASSHNRTVNRYSQLRRYLSDRLGIECSIDVITKEHDEESGYKTVKKSNPAEDFRIERNKVIGKKIILIDDVITRGRTFCCTADKLIECGTSNVLGLFVAKTIHPA